MMLARLRAEVLDDFDPIVSIARAVFARIAG
jgi:hypothetical protein